MATFKFQDLIINVERDEDGAPVLNVGGCGPNTKEGCVGDTQPGCDGGTQPGCGGGTQPGCNGGTNPMGGCGGGTKFFGIHLDTASNIRTLRDKLREVIDQLDILEQEQGGGD